MDLNQVDIINSRHVGTVPEVNSIQIQSEYFYIENRRLDRRTNSGSELGFGSNFMLSRNVGTVPEVAH